MSDLDAARRSISATLDEIVEGERILRDAGADVRDPGEWMQLRDIVARIERRLMLQMPAKGPTVADVEQTREWTSPLHDEAAE